MKRRFGHAIRVTLIGEDLPAESNRVELDADVKDSNGIPAPPGSSAFHRTSSGSLG
jgi:hypothetical protein